MSKGKGKMILILYSGERVEAFRQDDRYYFCDGRKFKKYGGQVAAVEILPAERVKSHAGKKNAAEDEKTASDEG